MLLDSRELTSGSEFECDLCIVGGGAAGITMARALADTPLDVIVVESGGVNPDEATQALYEGQNIGAPLIRNLLPKTIEDTRLRYLGGSTNHWAGWFRPLQPVDFESRPYLPISGWPMTREDLDPWYEEAQEVCLLGRYAYEPGDWVDEAGPAVIDNERVATTILQISYPAVVRPGLPGRPPPGTQHPSLPVGERDRDRHR